MGKENDFPIEKLFGSKTRTKLLDLFFGNPTESYYVRETARLVDEQINSVRRELSNLVGLEIVKTESYDGKTYYSANEKHRFFKPMCEMFSKKTVEIVNREPMTKKCGWDEYIKPVKNYLQALLITNKPMNGSGMDMLIIGDNREKKLSNWALLMEQKKGRPLNFMILSLDEFMYRKSVKDKMLMDIFEMETLAIIDPDKIIRR